MTVTARVHTHRALRLGASGGGLLLSLLWLAPQLSGTSLWYGLCALATLSLAAGLWRAAYHIATPLNTAANLVRAIREGDYSLRGRLVGAADPADLLMHEINALGAQLRDHRVARTEASELLEKVVSEIDTAVLAFDASRRVVLENQAASALLGQPTGSLSGKDAEALGLGVVFSSGHIQRLDTDFPGALGPFELRVQPFRYRGLEHTLLVMTSVGRLLRDEERRARRQIIVVLSHEINNSLAPMQSLAVRLQSLTAELRAGEGTAGMRAETIEDIQTGLAVIARRAGHLATVMRQYAKLARTPEPVRALLRVRTWVERNVRLWPNVTVSEEAGQAELSLLGDEALLDQVLLNLLKNAVEATAGANGAVTVSWQTRSRWLTLVVADRGQGLPEGRDPFQPFVTSKPEGSGIGLALCREVAESHGGRLELVSRDDGPGCLARLTLPLDA